MDQIIDHHPDFPTVTSAWHSVKPANGLPDAHTYAEVIAQKIEKGVISLVFVHENDIRFDRRVFQPDMQLPQLEKLVSGYQELSPRQAAVIHINSERALKVPCGIREDLSVTEPGDTTSNVQRIVLPVEDKQGGHGFVSYGRFSEHTPDTLPRECRFHHKSIRWVDCGFGTPDLKPLAIS